MKNLDSEIAVSLLETSTTAVPRNGFSEPGLTPSAGDSFQRIEQTVRYMNEHLDQPLQAAQLAALAHVSLSHYFALFKRCIGCAPIDFFIRLRMRRAGHLLETTTLNIKEIAAALGYDDPFYFSRVFKLVNGMAPSDYRRSRRDVMSKSRTQSAEYFAESERALSCHPQVRS